VSIQGENRYLWHAADQDDDVLDILVRSRKDESAINALFPSPSSIQVTGQPSNDRRLALQRDAGLNSAPPAEGSLHAGAIFGQLQPSDRWLACRFHQGRIWSYW